MAIDWDELVLQPLMSSDIFGEVEPVEYRPQDGWAFDITGVFDDGYKRLELIEGEPAISTSEPVLGVRLALFRGRTPPRQGDKVRIASARKVFVVTNVRPDGKGWAGLDLNISSDT